MAGNGRKILYTDEVVSGVAGEEVDDAVVVVVVVVVVVAVVVSVVGLLISLKMDLVGPPGLMIQG